MIELPVIDEYLRTFGKKIKLKFIIHQYYIFIQVPLRMHKDVPWIFN